MDIPRERLLAALQAEGVKVGGGYTNLHLLPLYQKKIAYGTSGFPWRSDCYRGEVSYQKGICPVAESMHENQLIRIPMCFYNYSDKEIDLIIESFTKVWNNLDEL